MVTIIRGMKVNSGKRKLKSINVVDHKYVNKKSNPYVNIKNKPIIEKNKLDPKPVNKYIGNLIQSDLEGLDKMRYNLNINGEVITKEYNDYEPFEFNTLSIEVLVTAASMSGGIVFKVSNGTKIKAVTSETGSEYTMNTDDNGENVILGLSIGKTPDTIKVTFEDDEVLDIPISYKEEIE